MQPNKRAAASIEDSANGESGTAQKKTKKTPFDLHFEKLKSKQDEIGAVGYMVIQGITCDEDNEDDHDDESEHTDDENAKYTEEQMGTLRHVLLTKNRAKQLEAMHDFVLGDQKGNSCPMFSTSFSYAILGGFNEFLHIYKNKSMSEKFDLLYGYTFNLKEYDVWLLDNEGGMDGMIEDLTKMWMNLLKKDDKKLGIDSEYTRPGVVQLLNDFKEKIESCYLEPSFRFRF
mmetsp:Transcript_21923/g.47705  ORF Transcript_21923/g.47705 Transcript_21923/m.47705 type:complete len:230 (+) Transcript_21923:314-1003(+)